MKIQVIAYTPGDSISGQFDNPAPLGLGVNFDPTNPKKLIPADGVKGYLLEKDVVAEIPLSEHVFDLSIRMPVKAGLEVSARKAHRIEVEGNELLVLSGDGAITSGTAADTELSYEDGRLRVKDAGAEVAAILRYTLDPEEAENGVRIHAEML